MGTITVWTKQNRKVLDELEQNGRFIAREDFIRMDLQEHTDLVLETYRWLAAHTTNLDQKPADVVYPVWVSFEKAATMLPDENTVILELLLEESMIARINIAKWGQILNYGYIPKDEADRKRHNQLLADYGTSDEKAFMTSFYPEIRAEIKQSWDRLFDPDIQLGNEYAYGNIWEVKKEWIQKIL